MRGVVEGTLLRRRLRPHHARAAGQVRVLANTATYRAYAGAAALGATARRDRIVADSLDVRTPSQGQRWAPYNRVFLDVGEASGYLRPADMGRSTMATAPPATSRRGAPPSRRSSTPPSPTSARGTATLSEVARQKTASSSSLWFPVESVVRPVISFRYGLEAPGPQPRRLLIILSLARRQHQLPRHVRRRDVEDRGAQPHPRHGAGGGDHGVGRRHCWPTSPFLLDDETGFSARASATLGSGDTGGGTEFFTLARAASSQPACRWATFSCCKTARRTRAGFDQEPRHPHHRVHSARTRAGRSRQQPPPSRRGKFSEARRRTRWPADMAIQTVGSVRQGSQR